jgi:hypothetical protein
MKIGFLTAVVFAAALPVSAHAAILTSDSFDSDPALAATQTAGAWYTDRYAPNGFSSESFMGDNRLALELAEADGAGNRSSLTSSFYDTQGRKYDTAGAQSIEIDFYIDSSWGSDRIGGLWTTGIDGAGGITVYGILEYFDNQFQIYDSGSASFVGLGTPGGFAADAFARLGVSLLPGLDTVEYFVNGEKIGAQSGNGAVSFSNVILQGVNRPAVDRTLYFDNFVAATTPISAVPLPAGLPLLALAMAGLFGVARRRGV